MVDPPRHGARWNNDVVAGLPTAQLVLCPMQEPATGKPAREEVKAGGAGGLHGTGVLLQGTCCCGESDGCIAPQLGRRHITPPQSVKPDGGRLEDASPSSESLVAWCS